MAEVLPQDRSVSRGRETVFHSSGRGGAGNIRRNSTSQSSPVEAEPVRGREPAVPPEREQALSQAIGRGGVGNILSTSVARAASQAPEGATQTASIINEINENNAEYERGVIQTSEEAAKNVHKSGRGGMGNITTSRSHSRVGALADVHSTGRGGRGNIAPGSAHDAEGLDLLDEFDRLEISHEEGIHSTGRGGRANITDIHSPPNEVHPHVHGTFESMGRGGAGNFSRSGSRGPSSPDRRDRSVSKDRHGIAKIWSKMSRQNSSEGESKSREHSRGRVAVPRTGANGTDLGDTPIRE
ncbi:hypothetical protein EUX98_g7921 [Antrodiella citrinella]|uniref:Uncharacterized protein n=1 Tax=Antrodiella citrinella TaxID=2447956 RepID=A0A4S4MEA5_9APHY|nr:hypothetical protein EUX98_g7921 [Antrodiella citrinella]